MILTTQVRLIPLLACLSAIALTPALASPRAGAVVKRPTQYETLYPWVSRTEPLTLVKLKKLVDWAALDAQSNEIVKTAMTRFGATDLASFLKLFTVDSNSSDNESRSTERGGLTNYGELNSDTLPILPADQFSSVNLETIEPYRSQIEAIRLRHHGYLSYAVNRSVNLRVSTFSNPTIYLARNQTLRQSYESFMHELTHFIRFDLRTEPNPLAFDSAEAFEAAYLLSPGQEVDARIAGVSALIRLFRVLPDNTSLPVHIENWFTVKGEVKAKPEQQLMVIRDFLGYRAWDLYRNRLEVLLSETETEWRALRTLPTPSIQATARIEVLEAEISKANTLLAHAK